MPRSRRSSVPPAAARVNTARTRRIASPVATRPAGRIPQRPVRRRTTLWGKIAALTVTLAGIGFLAFPTLYKLTTNGIPGYAPVREQPEASGSAAAIPENQPFRLDKQFLQPQSAAQSPLRVVIPSLSIDLSVRESKIVNGFWEVSETTASHGLGSAYPGQNGNIVVFAHARERLFLPLRNIKNDATVYILTSDSWHRYRVTATKLVAPADVTVIAPTEEETLTLFTCSGFMDSKRLIVTAKPYRP